MVTNHVPLRIKTLARLIRLYENTKAHFSDDLNRYEEMLDEDYWPKIIELLAPEIASEVNIQDTELLLNVKVGTYPKKVKKLYFMYLRHLH